VDDNKQLLSTKLRHLELKNIEIHPGSNFPRLVKVEFYCPWTLVRLMMMFQLSAARLCMNAALFNIFALIFGSLSEVASTNILSRITLGIRFICIRVKSLTIHPLLVHYNINHTCSRAAIISHKFDHFCLPSRVFLLIIPL